MAIRIAIPGIVVAQRKIRGFLPDFRRMGGNSRPGVCCLASNFRAPMPSDRGTVPGIAIESPSPPSPPSKTYFAFFAMPSAIW